MRKQLFGWRYWVSSLAVLVLMAGPAMGSNVPREKVEADLALHEHVPGEAVVKVKAAKGIQALSQLKSVEGVAEVSAFETDEKFFLVKSAQKSGLANLLLSLRNNPAVEYAEPNYIYRTSQVGNAVAVSPNDPDFAGLWGLSNQGQADAAGQVGVAGADIGAVAAWDQATGSRDIVVAVIDTGIDYNHPDLAANIYRNPGEMGDGKESNGIDDDGNGFIDDHVGWNFAGVSTNNPMDDNSHGTHCAGTIGAVANNGIGVVGVAWNVRMLPIKFLTGGGSGTLADAVKSIQYATLMNVNVMSNSWGGGGFSQAMLDSIVAAKAKGIMFVAAAGNDGSNADSSPHYPSSYQVDNVLAVAASDNRDQLAGFSNFGKRSVQISAPGVKILSTLPNNAYGAFSGTSMAAPHVSGAVAVLWGTDLSLGYLAVKDRIVNSRDPKSQFTRKIASSGRLNLYNALNEIYLPSTEPAESDWVNGDPITPIETAHPYLDNQTQEWVITGPANAKYMRVRFARYDLETRYDVVRLLGADGAEVDMITGLSNDPFYSWYVSGNEVRVKFTSDSSVTKWGFIIDGYQFIAQ